MTTTPNHIGMQFAQRRVELGLTQAELARLANMSGSGIYRLENGTRAPLLSTCQALCRVLEVGLTINDEGRVALDIAGP